MPPKRTLPSGLELQRELRTGITQTELARKYGVTRSAISWALKDAGLQERRVRYDDYIPWRVQVEHQPSYDLRMLRQYARMRLGLPVRAGMESMLQRWMAELDSLEAVLDYRPDRIEQGFYYTKRSAGDRDYVRWSSVGNNPYAKVAADPLAGGSEEKSSRARSTRARAK